MEHVVGIKNPRVAIVNNGAEEEKGNALVKKLFRFSKKQKVLLPNLKLPWMMILILQMHLRQFLSL